MINRLPEAQLETMKWNYIERSSTAVYIAMDEKVVIDVSGWVITKESIVYNPYSDGRPSAIKSIRTTFLNKCVYMPMESFVSHITEVMQYEDAITNQTELQLAYYLLYVRQWIMTNVPVSSRHMYSANDKCDFLMIYARESIKTVITDIIRNLAPNPAVCSLEGYFQEVFKLIDAIILLPLISRSPRKQFTVVNDIGVYERCIGGLCRIFHLSMSKLTDNPVITESDIVIDRLGGVVFDDASEGIE